MVVEGTSPTSSQVEVFDRILDKGIVIDAWGRIALMGIDLVTVQAFVVVASIQTSLESSEALALVPIEARTNAVTGPDADSRQRQKALKRTEYRRSTPLGGYRKTGTFAA